MCNRFYSLRHRPLPLLGQPQPETAIVLCAFHLPDQPDHIRQLAHNLPLGKETLNCLGIC